ncbi:hypothetical protein T439DRAFT_383896 [Meredithblackwellia eburnea MCA 4105]
MDVDRSSGSRSFRGARGGGPAPSTRPGPSRINSGGAHRSSPYTRTPPTPAPDGKWTHDLFSAGSDVNNPRVNLDLISQKIGKPLVTSIPSTRSSLRPFGEATPPAVSAFTVQPTPVTATVSAPPARDSSTDPNIFNRIGIRGLKSETERQQNEERKRRAAEEERRKRFENERERKAREAENRRLREIATREAEGFVVQVEGLVFGTSAEDVQTAFGSYGETSFCIIVNQETASPSEDLIARLVFERKKDASEACLKLNGGIADGRPLKVFITTPTPLPDELAPGPSASNGRSSFHASAPTPVPAPPPPTRMMYADQIEAQDPRSRTQPSSSSSSQAHDNVVVNSDMEDVDMAPAPAVGATPTGPAAMMRRGAGAGAGAGAGGRGRSAEAPKKNLLQRMAPPSGPRGKGNQGPAVMTGTGTGRGNGASNAKRGGGGGGGGAGGSLLSRLG